MDWARYRTSRAIATAALLFAFLGYYAIFAKDNPVVQTVHVEGTLVEIKHFGTNPILIVELEDGRSARVTPSTGLTPQRIGTKVPLKIFKFADGTDQARFDEVAWMER